MLDKPKPPKAPEQPLKVYSINREIWRVDNEGMLRSVVLICLGVAALVLGYYGIVNAFLLYFYIPFILLAVIALITFPFLFKKQTVVRTITKTDYQYNTELAAYKVAKSEWQKRVDEYFNEKSSQLKADVQKKSDWKAKWIADTLQEFSTTQALIDLINTKSIENISYSDLLHCVEWKLCRLKILVRDGYQCQDCSLKSERNHVHHTYYLKSKLPWDIDDNALVTLCRNCHVERHKKEVIGVFHITDSGHLELVEKSALCSRCHGAGHFPEYNHVESGICFKCGGACFKKDIFGNILSSIKQGSQAYDVNKARNELNYFLASISLAAFQNSIVAVRYSSLEEAKNLPF